MEEEGPEMEGLTTSFFFLSSDEGTIVGPSSCLPDLKEIALTFFGFTTVCAGNLSEFCDYNWFKEVAI